MQIDIPLPVQALHLKKRVFSILCAGFRAGTKKGSSVFLYLRITAKDKTERFFPDGRSETERKHPFSCCELPGRHETGIIFHSPVFIILLYRVKLL